MNYFSYTYIFLISFNDLSVDFRTWHFFGSWWLLPGVRSTFLPSVSIPSPYHCPAVTGVILLLNPLDQISPHQPKLQQHFPISGISATAVWRFTSWATLPSKSCNLLRHVCQLACVENSLCTTLTIILQRKNFSCDRGNLYVVKIKV